LLARYITEGALVDELLILEVCRVYGWTYDEYMAQPNFFTYAAMEKLIIDNKAEKRRRDALQ
jgi:hypothetical protein